MRYAIILSLLFSTTMSFGQLDLSDSDSLAQVLADSIPSEIIDSYRIEGPCEIVGGPSPPQILPIYKGCRGVTPEEQIECMNREVSDFIKKKVKIPKELKDSTFAAKVYVSLVINENADVSQVQVERSTNIDLPDTMKPLAHLLDDEAMRVISKLKFITPRFLAPSLAALDSPSPFATSARENKLSN